MRTKITAVVGVVVAVGVLALVSRSGDDSAVTVDPIEPVSNAAPSGAGGLAEPEATAETDPFTRIRLGDLGAPVTSSASCDRARGRAAELRAELALELTADDRAAAEQSVGDALARGQTEADGYDLFAGGAALEARFVAAAWGALEAAAREWRPAFVSNVGVYLLYLDRLDDAELKLRCARELDPRSPFTIEAQAMLAKKRSDCDDAKRLIALAVQLLPGDMNVRYTAGIVHHDCGDRARALQYLRAAERLMPDDETVREALRAVTATGDETLPREPDALDRLLDECLAFLDETVARAELASDYGNLVQAELYAGDWSDVDFAENARSHAASHRERIRTFEALAREGQSGSPEAFAWNQTVYACVDAYSEAAYDYEEVLVHTTPFMVMAAAMRMEPEVYARHYSKGFEDLRARTGRGWHGFSDLEYVLLDEDDRFEEALLSVDDALDSCLQATNNRAGRAACHRAWCGAAVPLWEAYRNGVAANMVRAEAGFADAAEDYGIYWLDYASRVSDFTARSVEALLPVPASPGAQRQQAEAIVQIARIRTDAMIEALAMRLGETYGSLQNALLAAPPEVLSAADSGPNGRGYLCPQDRPGEVPIDPPLDPFLEALKAATSGSADVAVDCEVSIGEFTVNVKPTRSGAEVKLSQRSSENNRISAAIVAKPGGRFGGEVSYSKGGVAPPVLGPVGVAAKATVKLWGEAGGGRAPSYGAQIEGKAGFGSELEGVGKAACYVFSAKARFDARAFADSLRA
jgi:Flp pilus assembly protein TadD